MVVEAQREGAQRECKENNPPNGMLGGKKAPCRIQPFVSVFLSL